MFLCKLVTLGLPFLERCSTIISYVLIQQRPTHTPHLLVNNMNAACLSAHFTSSAANLAALDLFHNVHLAKVALPENVLACIAHSEI